jgi:hypothetical protein
MVWVPRLREPEGPSECIKSSAPCGSFVSSGRNCDQLCCQWRSLATNSRTTPADPPTMVVARWVGTVAVALVRAAQYPQMVTEAHHVTHWACCCQLLQCLPPNVAAGGPRPGLAVVRCMGEQVAQICWPNPLCTFSSHSRPMETRTGVASVALGAYATPPAPTQPNPHTNVPTAPHALACGRWSDASRQNRRGPAQAQARGPRQPLHRHAAWWRLTDPRRRWEGNPQQSPPSQPQPAPAFKAWASHPFVPCVPQHQGSQTATMARQRHNPDPSACLCAWVSQGCCSLRWKGLFRWHRRQPTWCDRG